MSLDWLLHKTSSTRLVTNSIPCATQCRCLVASFRWATRPSPQPENGIKEAKAVTTEKSIINFGEIIILVSGPFFVGQYHSI